MSSARWDICWRIHSEHGLRLRHGERQWRGYRIPIAQRAARLLREPPVDAWLMKAVLARQASNHVARPERRQADAALLLKVLSAAVLR